MSSIEHKRFNTFSEVLHKALIHRGLTNRKFAEKLGFNESQVSHWLNDRHVPFKKTQNLICEVLNVKIYRDDKEYWNLTIDRKTENAADDFFGVKEESVPYITKEPTLDDLPELVKLRNMIEAQIDKLLRRRKEEDD